MTFNISKYEHVRSFYNGAEFSHIAKTGNSFTQNQKQLWLRTLDIIDNCIETTTAKKQFLMICFLAWASDTTETNGDPAVQSVKAELKDFWNTKDASTKKVSVNARQIITAAQISSLEGIIEQIKNSLNDDTETLKKLFTASLESDTCFIKPCGKPALKLDILMQETLEKYKDALGVPTTLRPEIVPTKIPAPSYKFNPKR